MQRSFIIMCVSHWCFYIDAIEPDDERNNVFSHYSLFFFFFFASSNLDRSCEWSLCALCKTKVDLKFVWCYKIARCFAIWTFYIVSFVVLWKRSSMMGIVKIFHHDGCTMCISVFYMNSIECSYEGKHIFLI